MKTDKGVTESGMMDVIYLTWLTVIMVALTFVLSAHSCDPTHDQRLMILLAVLIFVPDSDIVRESYSNCSQQNHLIK